MRCAACGSEVIADSVYCHHCGARLDEQRALGETAPLEDEAAPPEQPAAPNVLQRAAAQAAGAAQDAESDLWEGTYSPRAMIGTWVASGLVSLLAIALAAVLLPGYIWWVLLALVVLWLVLACRYYYRRLGIHYRLTTQRFFHETGILRRTTDRVEVIDMDDITVRQGPVERLVGVGTVRITSSDKTHPELLLVGIDDAKQVADIIDQARRTERRRRGLHIESI